MFFFSFSDNGAKIVSFSDDFKDLFDKMVATAQPNQEYVMIGHGADLDSANQLKDLIVEHYGSNIEVVVHTIGPVIGAHTGQGVLALFYLAQER